MHGDGVFGLIEQHAMAAGAQAQQSFELAGERFHPAFAGIGVAVQRTQYRHGGALLNRTNLGRNAGCKPDFFTVASLASIALAAADMVHGEAEIRHHLLEGDAALGVLPEVLA